MSDDYNVGYQKPPKHSQFKPGSSGNPKGRPKGTKNLKTELNEELLEKIQIKEGGTFKKVSKQRAVLKSLMAKAVQGDTKAAMIILNMTSKYQDNEPEITVEEILSDTDAAILEEFKAKLMASVVTEDKTNDK